jgi:putative FmdB family regulatory protein
MPLYEYECESCGQRTEALQRVDAPPLAECPHCAGRLRKLPSAPAFHLKGSGWYVTDYARKGGGDASKREDKGAGAADSSAAAAKPAEAPSADKAASSAPAPAKKTTPD